MAEPYVLVMRYERMLKEAIEAMRLEHMYCPWCGVGYLGSDGDEQHMPGCDILELPAEAANAGRRLGGTVVG